PGGSVAVFTDFYAKILVVFILMMNTLTTPRRLQQISWIIFLCAGYVAARAVFDYARGVNLIEGGRVAGSIGGMFGNPNDLAMNLVSFIPAGLVVAMSRRHAAGQRLIAAAVVVAMLAATVFTQSRGGFLGLATAVLVLAGLGHHIRRQFAALMLVGALFALPLMPASFWHRMGSIIDAQADRAAFTGSREARRIVMQEGLDTFLAHPLTGVGAGQFKNYNPVDRRERWRETHNAPLQVAAETGIVGLALYAVLIWRGFRSGALVRAWLRRTRHWQGAPPFAASERALLAEQSIAATAGLAGWLVCAMFASVAYNWTFYVLFALVVSARTLTVTRATEALHAAAPGHA
ncbi:MAG: O-antigen ligase family protein, partial [Vicinamibacterales bacterium]